MQIAILTADELAGALRSVLGFVETSSPISDPKAVVFPTAAKYSITYRTSGGQVKDYEISNPIESNNEQIIAYAFGRGVRTFKKARISRLQKVG